MQLNRITATLGAVALGGVLVASTANVGASASANHQRSSQGHRSVQYHFVAPAVQRLRPHSTQPIGMHCGSADMSM